VVTKDTKARSVVYQWK